MYTQSHELVKSIRSAWRNLEILEKEAIRSSDLMTLLSAHRLHLHLVVANIPPY